MNAYRNLFCAVASVVFTLAMIGTTGSITATSSRAQAVFGQAL